ncbi:MAG: hypothetical protein ACO20G_01305 [Ilumatobacteraceae bacterium]
MADMKSLIRRQVRKHSPELANLDNKRRRLSGQARRYKGKVNRYGRDIKMPKGFKPPRGMKLVNPATAGSATTDADTESDAHTAADTPPADNGNRRLIIIAIAVVAILAVLTVIGLVVIPRAVDWWQDRGTDESAATTTVATTVAPTTTVATPTTTVPVVTITTWGPGSCVTVTDDLARPSTCDDATLVVTAVTDHPDTPLTSDEITEAQTILANLGVDITIDGILGRQTLTALDAATLTAGLGTDVDDHAKLAVIRSIGIPGSLDPDGPRPLQTTPDVCGDGSSWVATPDDVLCLGSR